MRKKTKAMIGALFFAAAISSQAVSANAATGIMVEDRSFEVLTIEEFELLSRCVMAEAGGERESVQYKVTEVILNRVDDINFPDSIEGVIYEDGQFEVVDKGTIDTAIPTEKVYRSVAKALNERTFPDCVVYFNSIGYFSFATPYCQDGNMWFSSN